MYALTMFTRVYVTDIFLENLFSKRKIRKKAAIDIFLEIDKHPVPNKDVLVR